MANVHGEQQDNVDGGSRDCDSQEFPKSDFCAEIQGFVSHLFALQRAYVMTYVQFTEALIDKNTKIIEFFESRTDHIPADGTEPAVFAVPIEVADEFRKLANDRDSMKVAQRTVPATIFCTLVHTYDAFLGALVRLGYGLKPEILNASQKQLTLSQILQFNSISEATEFIIEEELDLLLRDSHKKQLSNISKTFNIKIAPDEELFRAFIELTERRNLFVHCGGRVSRQYLRVCHENKCILDPAFVIGLGWCFGAFSLFYKLFASCGNAFQNC